MNLTQNLNSTKDAKLYKLKINYKIIFVELSTIFYMLMEDLHGKSRTCSQRISISCFSFRVIASDKEHYWITREILKTNIKQKLALSTGIIIHAVCLQSNFLCWSIAKYCADVIYTTRRNECKSKERQVCQLKDV